MLCIRAVSYSCPVLLYCIYCTVPIYLVCIYPCRVPVLLCTHTVLSPCARIVFVFVPGTRTVGSYRAFKPCTCNIFWYRFIVPCASSPRRVPCTRSAVYSYRRVFVLCTQTVCPYRVRVLIPCTRTA